MPLWEIEYFPAKGERNAPVDSLKELCSVDDIVHFQQKLRTLQELEYKDWNFKWLKQVRGFYQIKQGDFRGYFRLYEKKIVVLHFCRKVRQEATDEDIRVATNNSARYEKG